MNTSCEIVVFSLKDYEKTDHTVEIVNSLELTVNDGICQVLCRRLKGFFIDSCLEHSGCFLRVTSSISVEITFREKG